MMATHSPTTCWERQPGPEDDGAPIPRALTPKRFRLFRSVLRADDTRENPGISVKLSALHPRYEYGQREDVVPVLAGRVLQLACAAKDGALGFNIGAEEQDRLDLSLDCH